MERSWQDTVVNVLLGSAAVVAIVALVRPNESNPPTTAPVVPIDSTWVESRWDDDVARATFADSSAPITIVEFMDVECPFCARYHSILRAVADSFPNLVRVGYVHTRIPGHSNALRGALGVECANRQGKLEGFLEQVYRNQSEIGFTSWSEFASRAGVIDTLSFVKCQNEALTRDHVRQSYSLSEELEIPGTPTVIINALRFGTYPDEERIILHIRRLAASMRHGSNN